MPEPQVIHAVNRLLIDDTKRTPKFAKARRVAVRAWVKAFDATSGATPTPTLLILGVTALLNLLHAFEAMRGDGPEAMAQAANNKYLALYEEEARQTFMEN